MRDELWHFIGYAAYMCLLIYEVRNIMDDIPYSRIRVIYVLRPCAVGFALCNVRDIF